MTMLNAEVAKRRDEAISRGVGMMTQIYADRALNSEIWDIEGNRYIDFAAGIAVVNTGHCHPKVMAAVANQMSKFTHTCHQVMPYENYIRLAERLNDRVPGAFKKKTIFVTTGAEACENAVKIARIATGRDAVIAFGGGFHGRTFMGMALTGKVEPYKKGFGMMMPGVFHVPFPMEPHGISTKDAMAGIEKLFKADLDPARVAAIIFEPVQGEGGFGPREGDPGALRPAWHRDDCRRGADRICPDGEPLRDGDAWGCGGPDDHGQGIGRGSAACCGDREGRPDGCGEPGRAWRDLRREPLGDRGGKCRFGRDRGGRPLRPGE
jgi:hypothetical protein